MTNQDFTDAAAAYTDMVYRIALNWFKNVPDAEDVTQNTMLRLCRTDTVFQDEDHLRYWLARVAVNECKRLSMCFWRTRTVPLESAPETPSPTRTAGRCIGRSWPCPESTGCPSTCTTMRATR